MRAIGSGTSPLAQASACEVSSPERNPAVIAAWAGGDWRITCKTGPQ